MTNQPSGRAPLSPPPETGRAASVQTAPGVAPGSNRTQQCPNCGGLNHARATVCQECGEPLRNKPKTIRCRQCRQTAPSNLIVCPHCGRELTPAPSRWLTWGAPALLVLLFLLLIFGRVRSGPFLLVRDGVDRGMALLTNVSRQMDPQASLVMTPIVDDASASASASVALAVDEQPADGQPAASESTDEEPAAGDSGSESGGGQSDAGAAEAAVVVPADTATATAEPTATPEPTATAEPTATPEPTATATPIPTATATPEPTATATRLTTARSAATDGASDADAPEADAADDDGTQTPAAGTVQSDDGDGGDAADEESAGERSAEADGATGDDDQAGLLLVPTPTSGGAALVPTATPLPTATPEPATYTIVAGDTLVVIASKLGVSTEAIMAANDLSPDDARRLRPGQILLVPDGETNDLEDAEPATAAATTATQATSTPTPVPPPTWTPTPAGPAYRLDTPQLRSPENNTPVSCNSENQLNWIAVPFMQDDDQYLMHLGFVSGIDGEGNATVTWILSQPRPANRTSWDMDNDLCSLAPQEFGRQWRWYVEVVDAAGNSVSRPSATWGFSWN